jgi:NAD(P)-dependent dehydrogenase (short-subunit alcohol dehydrogenase family)
LAQETAGPFLLGKHAVITGGGRGIGAAIANELAQLGANLTLLGRDDHTLETTAQQIHSEHGHDVYTHHCDVTDVESIAQAFAFARDEAGDPYVLVNNAGQAEGAPFLETSRHLWDVMIAVNLTGTFLCTQEVLAPMLNAGAGRIVNIASTAGLKGYARVTAYGASKHGVVGFTRSLAIEIARSGVTVNAVCPAYTETAMAQRTISAMAQRMNSAPAEARQKLERLIPIGRLIRPDEVAATVGWLCSPQAAAITGQAIAVAGGEV